MDYRGIMEKPFFTLSIRARGGKQLELSQDTPPGIFANGVMHSDHTLMLSTPIEKIPQGKFFCRTLRVAFGGCSDLCFSPQLVYCSINNLISANSL